MASFHYLPGGVKVDGRCESTVRDLYAVGQVQGGLFGADRLGSVSLTELFVFAKIAAESALENLEESPQPRLGSEMVESRIQRRASLRGRTGSSSPLALKRRLQRTMWQKVGLVRDEGSLQEALRELQGPGPGLRRRAGSLLRELQLRLGRSPGARKHDPAGRDHRPLRSRAQRKPGRAREAGSPRAR